MHGIVLKPLIITILGVSLVHVTQLLPDNRLAEIEHINLPIAEVSNITPKLSKPVYKAKATLAVKTINKSIKPNTAPTYKPSGNKETWLRASGIPENEWGYVDWIVSRESGWNPCAYNPGMSDCNANPSSACGLVQQYPCHKIPGDWRDPVIALKWQYQYVNSGKFDAYGGGYRGAVAYWKVHGNY